MAELDNVIKWLDVCKTSHYAVGIKEDYPCRLCPYHEKEYCMKQLITDALELLKEQKTVAKCDRCLFVKRDKLRKVIETDEFKCPACKKRVAGRMTDGTVLLETPGDDLPDYCCFCGQRLDWDIEEAVSQ